MLGDILLIDIWYWVENKMIFDVKSIYKEYFFGVTWKKRSVKLSFSHLEYKYSKVFSYIYERYWIDG